MAPALTISSNTAIAEHNDRIERIHRVLMEFDDLRVHIIEQQEEQEARKKR